MVLIKIRAPPKLESAFRRAASGRIGLRKGAIRDAGLAALAKYAGIDPMVALSASSTSVSVEAPASTMPQILAKLLPRKAIRVTTHKEARDITQTLGPITVLEHHRGYTYFEWETPDATQLSQLRSFRAEWDEQDLIFEEDCLNLTVDSLHDALEIARSLVSVLGLSFPEEKVTERLDICKWEGASMQENVIR